MKPFLRQLDAAWSAEEIYDLFKHESGAVFLDSAKDSYGMGRYSFIARRPFLIFTSKGKQVTIQNKEGRKLVEGNPFAFLKELLNTYHIDKVPGIPPLAGGIIGYFGYDLGYLLEEIPKGSIDDINVPDSCLGFYDTVLIFDHYEEKTFIASTGFPELEENARKVRAEQCSEELVELIKNSCPLNLPEQPVPIGGYTSNFTKEEYCKIIRRAIEYIAAGDIFQVNLSQRFTAPLEVDPYSYYRYLRHVNPAPFAAYLNFKDVIIASASPERYLSLKDGIVETRPIKGTRPRGHDTESDERMRQELLYSEKDRAELVMIIDLMRNDLGRVCEYGSVRVTDLIRLEEYATVFHLVSTVIGKLKQGRSVVDLLMSSFPGGSITGAPKVRAMEIIDELEPVRRNVYTGSIGYIDFNGDADLNIVIRTSVIKDNKVYFQVGGGIVADSVPEDEYQETLDKARALMISLGYKPRG